MSSLARPPSPTLLQSVSIAAGDIKLAHSVFALPFAILAAFLARPHSGPDARWSTFALQLALVIVCMVLARTFAMLVNRLADRHYDLKNPRTSRRAVASGRLPAGRALALTLLAAGAFIVACAGFWVLFKNLWPIALCVPTLAWIALYSFTKRFTWLCHIFLGGALAASPLAAAIAVRPEALLEWSLVGTNDYLGFGAGATLALIAAMVLTWVAGFDIIYALQDVDFDREQGLWSIPSRLGVTRALWLSRALHAASFLFIFLAGASDWRFGWLFDSAIGAVAMLLISEHLILAIRGKAGLDMAFFTLNGVVSCVLGVAGVVDLVLL